MLVTAARSMNASSPPTRPAPARASAAATPAASTPRASSWNALQLSASSRLTPGSPPSAGATTMIIGSASHGEPERPTALGRHHLEVLVRVRRYHVAHEPALREHLRAIGLERIECGDRQDGAEPATAEARIDHGVRHGDDLAIAVIVGEAGVRPAHGDLETTP